MNESIIERLREGRYRNKMDYPKRWPFKCLCGAEYGHARDIKFCPECGAAITEAKAEHFAEIEAAQALYNKETARLNALFQADVFEDLGITDHPKRHKLWAKAYDMGHSAGMGEVYHYCCELVELIQ